MIKSTYIHIPFCKKKCNYCSFTSFSNLEMKTIYLDSLLNEINHFYDKTPQKTLYIGGGTPSILSVGDFEEILNCFNFEKNPEITVEVNPESATKEYLKEVKDLGVNRLSVGCQTFDDNILLDIGRIHKSKDSLNTINWANEAGFYNISADLIYGLPNQNLKIWEKDLNTILSLDIQHVSLYGLKIDKGCYFYKNKPENIADDDVQADMYILANDVLGEKFSRYEISNFAKEDKYKGRHNLNYWTAGYYYGFGVGASGYFEKGRYTNTKSIEEYIKNPEREKTFEKVNRLEEKIFLGLRCEAGIDTDEINDEFCINFDEKYQKILKKYEKYFIKNKSRIKLSTSGLLISNEILCEFLD